MSVILKPNMNAVEITWRALTNIKARSVSIVSAEGGEGNSLVANAIARRAVIAFGKPVLLVDLSDVTPPPMLTDENHQEREVESDDFYLTDQHQDDGIVRDMATRVGILSRPDRSDPVWREPALLRARVDEWLKDWAFVVFDTAPLLTREAEAVPPTGVASSSDACIMVTLAGVTPVNRIAEAKSILERSEARLIGALLNDRENPPLLSELERETFRLQKFFPNQMTKFRNWMRHSSILGVTI